MEALDKELRSPAQPLVTQNYRFLGFINDVGEALHSFLPKPIYVRGPANSGVAHAGGVLPRGFSFRRALGAAAAAARSQAASLTARSAAAGGES